MAGNVIRFPPFFYFTTSGRLTYTAVESIFKRGCAMDQIIVNGGLPLSGAVSVGGSKNAALPILFAGILTADTCVFYKLPRVSDVLKTLEILKFMGAKIRFYPTGEVSINYKNVKPLLPPACFTRAIRGSTYLLGSLLGRFGEAHLAGAGGCDFGNRPIDQHLLGFSALGADAEERGGELHLFATNGLHGTDFRLAMPSVGATANLIMAASAAHGDTVIRNAAAEPHVGALAAFLSAAGARIVGAPGETVRITGNIPLYGCEFTMIPDMIEAGTYLAFGMACGGHVTVTDVVPDDLGEALNTLRRMGGRVIVTGDAVTVISDGMYQNTEIVTGPYPAFPTDLQPQFTALFSLGGRANGEGRVTDTVFSGRFRYAEELCRLGADIRVCRNSACVIPAPLTAGIVTAPDLRGGAALLLAALATKGESTVQGAALIGRGYEHLCEKLTALGAAVRGI